MFGGTTGILERKWELLSIMGCIYIYIYFSVSIVCSSLGALDPSFDECPHVGQDCLLVDSLWVHEHYKATKP